MCTRRDPTRSAPNTPSTSPCTWNKGRPCTSVSSGDHCQAWAKASRSAATARRDSTTPFGRPVVPDVYMISAVESAEGSPPVHSASPPTDTCGSVTSSQCGSPIVAAAPESRSMCSRSMGPASDGIGTIGTPAMRPATTPITVSSVLDARNATAGIPERRSATAPARRASWAHDSDCPATVNASGWSPISPVSDGRRMFMVPPSAPRLCHTDPVAGPARTPRECSRTERQSRSRDAGRRLP